MNMKKVISLAVVLFIAIFSAGCSVLEFPESSSSEIVASMPEADTDGAFEAKTLSEQYEMYPEKMEEHEGEVWDVQGSFYTISSPDRSPVIQMEQEAVMGYIYFYMSEDDPTDFVKLAEELSEGDKIIVRGTLSGKMGHIMVKDCWYIGKAE